jgi:ketosteroid isomerase-like protein
VSQLIRSLIACACAGAIAIAAPLGAPLGAPLSAQRAPVADPGGEARATFTKYKEVLNAADWPAVLSFYADDPRFEWIENGEVRYASKDAIAPAFEAMVGTGSKIRYVTDPPRIAVLAPSVVNLRTKFETTITDKDGKPFTFGGMITIDMIKTVTGWKFLRGHISSNGASR